MRRGELVTVAVQGDYGKPRPAIVAQSDWLTETESVLVCPVTGELREAPIFRLTLQPSAENGLRRTSQVMVDKVMPVRRDKCGPVFGRIDAEAVVTLNRMLALVIGIAE